MMTLWLNHVVINLFFFYYLFNSIGSVKNSKALSSQYGPCIIILVILSLFNNERDIFRQSWNNKTSSYWGQWLMIINNYYQLNIFFIVGIKYYGMWLKSIVVIKKKNCILYFI